MRIQLAADIARRANDLESCLREMEGLVGNSVAAHESIPAAIGLLLYCKGEPRKPSMPAPILAMTPIASLRWQAQLQGHGAVLMRSPEDKYAFSAP